MKTLLRNLRRLGACTEAVTWAKTQPDPETLWRECQRGDWMLWLAARTGVRRQDVVLAACACARLALPRVRPGEERPRIAIETAEAWARGDEGVTLAQVRFAADDAADDAAAAAYAAAAYAAADDDADDDAADDDAYAAAAYAAAAYAAADADADDDADDDAADDARKETLLACASLVRERIPWIAVAAALSDKETEP